MDQAYKHVKIERHPLRNAYAVINITFPAIPPYFGTLKQCQKAAAAADRNAAKLAARLLEK